MGTAHCGSTLLSLLLSCQTECFSVGEISNLPTLYKNHKKICSICEDSCTFWEQKISSNLDQLSRSFQNQRSFPFIPLKIERRLRAIKGNDPIVQPYTTILSHLPQVNVLIDSTKVPKWISTELSLPEFQQPHLSAKLLYLVRDGRAVMASWLRRHRKGGKDADAKAFCQYWLKRVRDSQALFEKFPNEHKLKVQYEEFALAPEVTLQSIGKFLEIPIDESRLEYWKYSHHAISGNSDTKDLILKYKDQEERGKTKFEIRLDRRWKSELSETDLSIFNKLAGELNQHCLWDYM
jgi:hypothetical protein